MTNINNISKALIVGYGSIGKKHAEILSNLGLNVAVLSSRKHDIKNSFISIQEAKIFNPDYVVIASSTEKHFSDFEDIINNLSAKVILIEKPVFDIVPQKRPQKKLETIENIFVGYNLRFYPVIQTLKHELEGQKIISAHMYVGQYLPDWRPDRNHKETYSSIKNKGGGVLRDLSHELDLCQHLFGKNQLFHSIGGRFSDITVDSDDVYCFIMKNDNCPAISLQINYLDRIARRNGIINTENNSYRYDLINSTIEINKTTKTIITEKNDSYISMHKAIINSNFSNLPSLNDGLSILDMICQAEKEND